MTDRTPMARSALGRAREWLDRTYGGLVVLAGEEPVHTTEHATLFGCGYARTGEPLLAATIRVPADGGPPFPVANAAPLAENGDPVAPPGEVDGWRWRVNARNCVVAADVSVDGHPASACAWQPADEAPGWWDRLLARHFPDTEVATCETWAQAGQAVVDGGPDSRAVVWLRRHIGGRRLTGHLLYARRDERTRRAVLLDPQVGTLATTTDDEVDSLVVARFHRSVRGPVHPWEAAADAFPAAVAKATSWLDHLYRGEVTLVAPDPADETNRGWLFACTTTRFLRSGDWHDQMLDAALLVPKAAGETPSGLPNRDPWTWLREWDEGATGLPAPPGREPGAPAWFAPLTERLGRLHEARPHRHWAGALAAVDALPVDTLALIWLRRKDNRNRETVGHLLWAVNRAGRIDMVDPTAPPGAPPVDADPFELRVFRVDSPASAVLGS
jgi:hypothetical protein